MNKSAQDAAALTTHFPRVHVPLTEIPSRVLDAIIAFERGAKATDDKTIVVMRRG